MTISPAYEIAAIFFDIVVCVFVGLTYTDSSKTSKSFLRFAVLLTIACMGDAFTCIIMANDAFYGLYVNYFIHAFNIFSSTLAAEAYTEYVIACIGVDIKSLVFTKINVAVIVIQTFLILQNLYTGNVYTYSVEAGYAHGPLFIACSIIVPLYYILLATGFMVVNYMSYSVLQIASMSVSTVVLILVYVLQIMFFQRVSLAFFAASIALLILFFTLETPDYHKLENTIDKLEKAEKDAHEARRKAEEANDAKSEFLSQMSHEIRTPINSILGYNNLILENTKEIKTSEYSGKIKGAGENLLAFFNNLLSVIAQNDGETVDIKKLFDYSSLIDKDVDEVLVPVMPKASVLVVDDNAMNVDLLLKILKKTEMTADTATDGQKALMKLRKRKYDLIIMDYMMPVMDGVETLSIMREERLCPGSPVVMLTAGGLRGDEGRFKELGFDAYLTKPVVANTLYELLSDIMPVELIEQRTTLDNLFYKENQGAKTTAESVAKRSLEDVFEGIDTKAGLSFCMDDEEFYISQLEMFADSGKGDELEGYFENKDWDNYLITVHAFKSTARTIGANDIADEALALETALKEGRPDEVLQGHSGLKEHFDKLAEMINKGIAEINSAPESPQIIEEPQTAIRDQEKSSDAVSLSNQILLALANTVDSREMNGHGRSMRVARYSAEIARRLGKSEEEQRDIYFMGLVHDIGKLVIPEKILRKPDSLTDEESEIVRQHPIIGYEILRNVSEMPGLATGARWHHERYDGSGYPDGLMGEEIPIEARIIGIADAYDAMTSERPYASVMPPSKIIKELDKNRGIQFDPVLADILIEMIGEGVKAFEP